MRLIDADLLSEAIHDMSMLHMRMQVGQKKTAWLKLVRHRPLTPSQWSDAESATTKMMKTAGRIVCNWKCI